VTTRTQAKTWNDGYVVDVAYTEPIFPSICPAQLSMSAVLGGQPPLPDRAPLTWVDLGSGSGLHACMVAAANAGVEVWGYDFNPAHVERARSLADRAGLDNCRFEEASFAELAEGTGALPEQGADVIVVNGVYSWISRTNQLHIGSVVRRLLRPGGLVFVSYGVPTGWSAMTPVAEALHLRATADPRRSDLAFPAAASELLRLAEAGARYFPLPAAEANAFAELAKADARYSAHEYLGAHFRPLMHPEVAEVMAGGRCTFLGPLDATGQLWRLGASAELVELVATTPAGPVREVLRDLVAQRSLRRDLFRKGMATPTAIEQRDRIDALAVVGTGQALDATTTVSVPLGSTNLDHGFYGPLVERLGSGPVTVADILAVHPDLAFPDAVGSLAVLVGAGYAAPLAPGGDDLEARARSRRLNEVLIHENRNGGDHQSLVSPRTGGAVTSEYVEMLTMGALWEGEAAEVGPLADRAVAELARQDRLVREAGELIRDPAAARTIIEGRVERALERADGLLRSHGIT
jgi:SAM-dependent methyltransferase